MTSPNEKKILDIFHELKMQNHIDPSRVLKASKTVPSFKAGLFSSSTISFNPNLIITNDDEIRFCLLHEEGHLTQGQYGISALLLLWSIGIIPTVCLIALNAEVRISIISCFFTVFVVLSSIRILTEPLQWDEYGSDEYASKILRDNYNIKKPSEIVRKTLNNLPPICDSSTFYYRLFLAFFEYHPSIEQRVRNISESIDEKM